MNDQPKQDAIALLAELELITPDQVQLLSQHPDAAQFKRPEDVLSWMIDRGELDEDDLLELWDVNPSNMSDEKSSQREDLIDAAWEHIYDSNLNQNKQILAALNEEALLHTDQFNRIKDELPLDEVFSSPAAAMAWLVINHQLSEDEWQAIQEKADKESIFSSAQKRAAIISATNEELQKYRISQKQIARKKFWDSILPGPGLRLLMGFMVVGAALAYLFNGPKAVPSCDESDIVKIVRGQAMSREWWVDNNGTNGQRYNFPPRLVNLKSTQEVGYLIDEKTRACVVSLQWNGGEYEYGYVIKPSAKGNEYDVVGGNAEIIKARYSNIDTHGRLGNLAEPVGRDNLVAAIRSGTKQYPQADWNTGLLKQLMLMAGPRLRDNVKTDSLDIEPLESCRPVDHEGTYQCDVLMLANDGFLEAIGRPSLLVTKSTFTLKRQENGNGWAVTDNFPKEYYGSIAMRRNEVIAKAQRSSIPPVPSSPSR